MLQPFRHFAVDDALRAFDDGGFTHAGSPISTGLFWYGAAAPDGAADLFVTADYRVKFALLGAFGQIDRVFLQCLPLVFGALVFHAVTASHLFNGFADFVGRCAGRFQQVGQRAAVFQHRKHKQLGRNEFVRALLRQLVAQVQDAHQLVGRLNVATGAFYLR